MRVPSLHRTAPASLPRGRTMPPRASPSDAPTPPPSLVRRTLLALGLATATAPSASAAQPTASRPDLPQSDSEWKAKLTPAQYNVLRRAGTERAFTGAYWDNKAEGVYKCAGCGTPVFESAYKYDSGTGWPSFGKEMEGNVAYEKDTSIPFMPRTEEHCAVCGGHLGHVFNDGPKAMGGKRHCINSAALEFVPKGK